MKLCLDVDWQRQRLCLQEPPSFRFRFQLGLCGAHFEGENMQVTLTDVQKVDAGIQIVDAKGNPALVDGAPVWAASDPALDVQTSPDGMTATISAVGPLGAYQVTVTADADLGAGVVPLMGILDVVVVASEAVAVNVVPGVPVSL
jgi:hypothetical protein